MTGKVLANCLKVFTAKVLASQAIYKLFCCEHSQITGACLLLVCAESQSACLCLESANSQRACFLSKSADSKRACILPDNAERQRICLLPVCADRKRACILPESAENQRTCLLPVCADSQIACHLSESAECLRLTSGCIQMLIYNRSKGPFQIFIHNDKLCDSQITFWFINSTHLC